MAGSVARTADLAALPAAALQDGALFLAGDLAGVAGVGIWRYLAAASDPANDLSVIAPAAAGGRLVLQAATIRADLTARIPSDYPTLGAAFDALSVVQCAGNSRIMLEFQPGHVVTSQTMLSGNDFSRFDITATDPEVPVDIAGDGNTGNVLYLGQAARSPRICALFNAAANTGTGNGFRVEAGATLMVMPGAGVINARGFGLRAFSALDIRARFSRFEGAGRDGIWIQQSANADIEGADVSGAGRNGLMVNHASAVTARLLKARGCGRYGAYGRHKSTITLWRAELRGAGETDLHVAFGAEVDARSAFYETCSVIVNDLQADGRVVDASRPSFRASGRWRPTVAGSVVAGAQGYAVRRGQWLREGLRCSLRCRVVMTQRDPAARGALHLLGLPFAPDFTGSRTAASGRCGHIRGIDMAQVAAMLGALPGAPALLSLGDWRIRRDASGEGAGGRLEFMLTCADPASPIRAMSMDMLQDGFECEIQVAYDLAPDGITFPSPA